MSDSFRFKQFVVRHDRCAMKVGTDGVLLGAWVDVRGAMNVLDVGTGTGLIAMMLAQRSADVEVLGIDIDAEAVAQAQDNMAACPWAERLAAAVADFADATAVTDTYDLIVSNPPFYVEDTSCPDQRRNAARHTSSLPMDVLMHRCAGLLSADGRVALIVPTSTVSDIIGEASMMGLYLSRRTDVRTTSRKMPKRTLLEFSRRIGAVDATVLDIRDTEGQFTESYIALTRDFYL